MLLVIGTQSLAIQLCFMEIVTQSLAIRLCFMEHPILLEAPTKLDDSVPP
jgi:hypothetical protein